MKRFLWFLISFFLFSLLLSTCISKKKIYNFLINGDFNYVSTSIEKNILRTAKAYLNNTNMFFSTELTEEYYQSLLARKKNVVIVIESLSLYKIKNFMDILTTKGIGKNKYRNTLNIIILGNPISKKAVLPFPWAFVGFNPKDIAKELLTVIPSKIKANSSILVLSPSVLTKKYILGPLFSGKEERNSDIANTSIKTNERKYFVTDIEKKEIVQLREHNPMYANESLAHATYLALKKNFNEKQLKELLLREYSRISSYTVLSYVLKHTRESISAVITFNDEVAIGALLAFKNNKMKIPIITGFGNSPEAQRYIENGELTASFKIDYKVYIKKIFNIAERMYFENANIPIAVRSTSIQTFKPTAMIYIPVTLK